MNRLTLFLALATAWSVDAVLMFALAEAGRGSIMNRMFAGMLMGLALIALAVAIGPQTWRSFDRLSVRLWTYWTVARSNYESRRRTVTPSHLATPTP